jgi:hypothetical protein
MPSITDAVDTNGVKYYINHDNKTTSRLDPRISLPKGWEAVISSKNNVYYKNITKQITLWNIFTDQSKQLKPPPYLSPKRSPSIPPPHLLLLLGNGLLLR